jgi:hypothetical protein
MEVPGSAVYAAYEMELWNRDNQAVNLVTLWHAAGRPRGQSPRWWYSRWRVGRGGDQDLIQKCPGGADAPLVVVPTAALVYAQQLDARIARAAFAIVDEMFLADPTSHVMNCPVPLVTFFAVDAMAQKRGLSHAEASRVILDETVERTKGLEAWEQETIVARVERALRCEPQPEHLTARAPASRRGKKGDG